MKKPLTKRLNWTGFWFMLPLSCLGILSNKSVTTLLQGIVLVIIFWLVFGTMFLILGKEDK